MPDGHALEVSARRGRPHRDQHSDIFVANFALPVWNRASRKSFHPIMVTQKVEGGTLIRLRRFKIGGEEGPKVIVMIDRIEFFGADVNELPQNMCSRTTDIPTPGIRRYPHRYSKTHTDHPTKIFQKYGHEIKKSLAQKPPMFVAKNPPACKKHPRRTRLHSYLALAVRTSPAFPATNAASWGKLESFCESRVFVHFAHISRDRSCFPQQMDQFQRTPPTFPPLHIPPLHRPVLRDPPLELFDLPPKLHV